MSTFRLWKECLLPDALTSAEFPDDRHLAAHLPDERSAPEHEVEYITVEL